MANDLDRIRRLAVDGIDTANHEYGTGELRELAELAVSLCSEVERSRMQNEELIRIIGHVAHILQDQSMTEEEASHKAMETLGEMKPGWDTWSCVQAERDELKAKVVRLRALVITAYDQKLTFKQIEELIK